MDDKNNYTRVPNNIIEALYSRRLSPLHQQIMLYVIRKTYGFHKDRDVIAVSRMARAIGRTRTKTSGGVADLIKMGMLASDDPSRHGRMIWIRQPEEWESTVTKSGHVTKTVHVTESGQEPSRKRDAKPSRNRDTQKKTIKETLQKKPPKPPIEESDTEAPEEWVDDLPPDDDPRWQG